MAQQKAGNRWLVVVGALLVQLCLGAIYAWATFTTDLQNSDAKVAMRLSPQLLGLKNEEAYNTAITEFSKLSTSLKEAQKGTDAGSIGAAKTDLEAFLATLDKAWIDNTFDRSKFDKQSFGFSATQTFWIFSAGLASFAFTMIIAGRLQDKHGPKVIAIIGGIVLGLGYILAGLLGGTSFAAVLFFIGIVGGAGIGLGYVCPIAASVKWFPDLKGLITGLAVAGFGAGAFIFVKLGGTWLNLVRDKGVSGTFTIFGIIFAVCVVAGGLLLSNPPSGWKPAGWDPNKATGGKAKPKVKDLTQGQIIATPQFWMIWLAFVFSAGCGLMIITSLKDFGILQGGLSIAAAGSAVGLLALFNGLGRVVWGTLSQKLTARLALVLMTVLQAAMMFVLLKMGSSPLTLAIAGCWIGFNFGGNFALFPLLTAENFGSKNLGANYGAVFTSYGVGGILGPVMAGMIWDHVGTYGPAFIIAGIACVVAAGLAFALRPPKVAAEAPVPAEA